MDAGRTWTPDYYLRCAERKILEYEGSALPRAGTFFYTPELKLIHLPDLKLTTLAIIYIYNNFPVKDETIHNSTKIFSK